MRVRKINVCLCLALCVPLLDSCKDEYMYDDEVPTWLNGSLYSYFETREGYQAYKTLIDEMGYQDILDRTGAVTVFPANDEAFARYFAAQGKSGDVAQLVRELPESEKKYLFNSSYLNMTYLSYQLANIQSNDVGGGEGMGLRRNTVSTYLDSVPYFPYADLPQKSGFWKRFEKKGGVYLADNGARPMVHFTPAFYAYSGLTESDWNIMARGIESMPYDNVGIYVNGVHVKPENMDQICENGYVHVPDEVVAPQPNMAEVINQQPEMSEFANLMEKFAYPYYNGDIDRQVRISKGLPTDGGDSLVFIKRYLNRTDFSDAATIGEDIDVNSYGMLLFDPANNQYGGNTDMGAIFVPSNQALVDYWNSDEGAFLKDNYGSMDEVATNLVGAFIQNHQRVSFTGSYPHMWDIMADPTGLDMNVEPEHIIRTYMANNGVIYLTNKVYPPVDYQSVYAPVLVSGQTTIMSPTIKNEQDNDFNMKYHFYLRSLDNQYNLLVPTDDALQFYRDPISWAIYENTGVDNREIWSFRLDRGLVVADVYDASGTGEKGEFIETIGTDDNGRWIVNNRLQDILDMHIVVADDKTEPFSGFIDEGTHDFLVTKGGSLLMPEGMAENVEVKAGGEIENGLEPAKVVDAEGTSRKAYYKMENGHTFFVDKILQDPFKSVYTAMTEQPKFDKFFSLLIGDENVMAYVNPDLQGSTEENPNADLESIFSNMVGTQSVGIGMVVSSFQNYHYTVLVPTDEAIDRAFEEDPNLMTWEEIDALIDQNKTPEEVGEKVRYLLEFLHYHFIDGILPVSDRVSVDSEFETAARREDGTVGFTPIHAQGGNGALAFSCTVNNQVAHVLTDDPSCYNILTRDFIVNNSDVASATQISASSRAVIHLVDRALNYHLR